MNRRTLALSLSAWFVLASVVLAADAPGKPAPNKPAAVVKVEPALPKLAVIGGKTLVLDAQGLPVGALKEFTPIDAGDGKWIVILSVAVNGELKVYKYPMIVGNSVLPPGPTPPGPPDPPTPPGPPDPPTPSPLTGLAKVAYDTTPTDAAARAKAGPLADAIEAVCAAAAAGRYKTLEEARSALPKAAADALGDQNNKWLDWSEAVAKEIDKIASEGKLTTINEYRAIWLEVVRGLREVK